MSAYAQTLVIDDASSEAQLALAAELLNRCAGVVMLDREIALRPGKHELLCEVVEPLGTVHRCAEEYAVLVENAARRLAASRLAGRLPDRKRRWVVVEDNGMQSVALWHAP